MASSITVGSARLPAAAAAPPLSHALPLCRRVIRHWCHKWDHEGEQAGKLLLFITAVPNTKLFAWGEEDSGGHVL
jgi:hypothetical protein